MHFRLRKLLGSMQKKTTKTLPYKMVIIKVCCCLVVGTVGKLDWVFFKIPSKTRFFKEPLKKQVDTNELLKLYSQTSHNIILHFVHFLAKILKNFFWNFSQNNQWSICCIRQWRNFCFVWYKNLLLKGTFFRLMAQQNRAQS